MSLVKYRIKEVAADFGVSPKEISQIVEKFFEKPKSPSQILTEEELNVVFDYFTQQNQIASLEEVFAVQPKPKAEPRKERCLICEAICSSLQLLAQKERRGFPLAISQQEMKSAEGGCYSL